MVVKLSSRNGGRWKRTMVQASEKTTITISIYSNSAAVNNKLIGGKNEHFKRKNAILLMKINRKHEDVEKVAPHTIIEKYKHTEMRSKYQYQESSLLQREMIRINWKDVWEVQYPNIFQYE